ncbi:MAG: hypothetical protein AAF726_21555 [Planctomycetota bacterium]
MNKRTLVAFALGAALSLAVASSLVPDAEPAMPPGWYGASSFAVGAPGGGLSVEDMALMQRVMGSNAALQGGGLGHVGGATPRDLFWSTGISAGNHDPVSGAGYVSVPGHGPVGYGM